MKILGIDTSGNTASAAVCENGVILAESTFATRLTHSQVILPLAKEVLSYAETELSDIGLLVCAAGPGSYTGLRIGISAVKALSFGLGDVPCCGVSTLEALAFGCAVCGEIVCAVMKARADLVYCAFFDCSDRKFPKRLTEDKVISADEAIALAAGMNVSVMFTGDAVEGMSDRIAEYLQNYAFAPVSVRTPKASALCFIGENSPKMSAEELMPQYLQITKAEKDLQEQKK